VWDGFSVVRKFRGVTYKIQIKNPDHICKGVAQLIVDGSPIEGDTVPFAESGTEVSVELIMGDLAAVIS
jgi:cellobiose phosphorylase